MNVFDCCTDLLNYIFVIRADANVPIGLSISYIVVLTISAIICKNFFKKSNLTSRYICLGIYNIYYAGGVCFGILGRGHSKEHAIRRELSPAKHENFKHKMKKGSRLESAGTLVFEGKFTYMQRSSRNLRIALGVTESILTFLKQIYIICRSSITLFA